MERFHEDIVACYLYTITKHGYPPVAGDSPMHLDEFSALGYTSIPADLNWEAYWVELVNSTDAYLLFTEALKRDNLKFNLDTANQGSKVEHLAVGEGTIHWHRFFETLDRIGYGGIFGIDIGGFSLCHGHLR